MFLFFTLSLSLFFTAGHLFVLRLYLYINTSLILGLAFVSVYYVHRISFVLRSLLLFSLSHFLIFLVMTQIDAAINCLCHVKEYVIVWCQ